MDKKVIKVYTEVNGNIYKSEVNRIIEDEEEKQITSCIDQIRKMLNDDGLSDVYLDYQIER